MVRFNERASYRVFPTSKTEWRYRNYETVLKFDPDPSGPCPSVEIETTSKTFSAERIDYTIMNRNLLLLMLDF